jgi:hypothetical protein
MHINARNLKPRGVERAHVSNDDLPIPPHHIHHVFIGASPVFLRNGDPAFKKTHASFE